MISRRGGGGLGMIPHAALDAVGGMVSRNVPYWFQQLVNRAGTKVAHRVYERLQKIPQRDRAHRFGIVGKLQGERRRVERRKHPFPKFKSKFKVTPTNNKNGGSKMPLLRGKTGSSRIVFKGKTKRTRRVSRKRRKKRKVSKRSKRRTRGGCKEVVRPGPSAECCYMIPNTLDDGTTFGKLPKEYNDVWHANTNTYTKTGTSLSLAGEEETMVFYNFTAPQVNLLSQTGQLVTDKHAGGLKGQGIFDPAPLAGQDDLGNDVTVRNYHKAYEKFHICWARVEIFMVNDTLLPCRVWVDYSTAKKWSDVHFHTDIHNSFNAQPAFRGYDAQDQVTIGNLMADPCFDLKKVPGLDIWKKPTRRVFYLNPGAELKVVYNFKNLVWDGKKHAAQVGGSNDFIPNFSQAFAITVRGLTGTDTSVSPTVGGFAKAQVTANMRVTFRGQRDNVMAEQKHQYVPNFPAWGAPTVALPKIVSLDATARS